MSEVTNVLTSINYVKGLQVDSNQNELDMFLHLAAISVTESWKDESFYTGAPELIEYIDKKFTAFMDDLFNKSSTWYRNMENILNLPNGKELLLEHGRENMVSYMAFASTEQKIVLNLAKTNKNAKFTRLLASVGMRGKVNPEKDVEGSWEIKYKSLLRKYKVLEKKYVRLEAKLKESKSAHKADRKALHKIKAAFNKG